MTSAQLKAGNFSNEYDDELRSPVQYCKKFKEDIKPNTLEHKFPKVRRNPNNNKKVKIKDEKKVNRGELDVIFERIKMKKSPQDERKKKNEAVKIEKNTQNIKEKNNDLRLLEEKSHRDENVKNDEKKLHKDEKKQKKRKLR